MTTEDFLRPQLQLAASQDAGIAFYNTIPLPALIEYEEVIAQSGNYSVIAEALGPITTGGYINFPNANVDPNILEYNWRVSMTDFTGANTLSLSLTGLIIPGAGIINVSFTEADITGTDLTLFDDDNGVQTTAGGFYYVGTILAIDLA